MESLAAHDIYLVGGAVRDKRLGLAVKDRDWVVVGARPDEMNEAGFRPVGKDFPVFLHPETHEEYALARTERKSGHGYHGFTFNTDTTVTLEQDLERRDLTINAMAERADGSLVDPFNGAADLDNRILRHVSEAFVEDPVRVLRVARFMARFAPMGFTVADETLALMRTMVMQGEVDHLVAERVWQEMHGALASQAPRAFIETLRECNALSRLLPEVDALFGVPQRPEYHPEIDSGEHTLLVLDQCALLSPGNSTHAYCGLCHDLGKALTPKEELPRHLKHEERGVEPTEALSERFRVPKRIKELAVVVTRWHLVSHRALELSPKGLHKLLRNLDVLRKPARLEDFLAVCKADARGRIGKQDDPYPQADYLRKAAAVLQKIDAGKIAAATKDKAEIPEAIRLAQRAALKEFVASTRSDDDE